MKKIISYILITMAVLGISACDSNTKPVENETNTLQEEQGESKKKMIEQGEEKEVSKIIEGAEYETESGSIRILGVEKADPNVIDKENAYILKYEVTNKIDEARDGYEIFYITIYQNSVEVESINSHTNDGSEQAKWIGNRHKSMMKGGTLIVAEPFEMTSDSELTVMMMDGVNYDQQKSVIVPVK